MKMHDSLFAEHLAHHQFPVSYSQLWDSMYGIVTGKGAAVWAQGYNCIHGCG